MSELARLAALHDARKPPHFLEAYEARLEPLRTQPIRLLELGTLTGGSIRMWLDYFPRGVVAGLDLDPQPIQGYGPRVGHYQGTQSDTALLDRIAADTAPRGFDVIIDDAAHIGILAKRSFWHLFDRHLKPGGLYAIEDWGTGYFGDWCDGSPYVPQPDDVSGPPGTPHVFPSHSYGMVGFVKQLVDECNASAMRTSHKDAPTRYSKFHGMTIHADLVLIEKARNAAAPGR